MKTRLLLGAVGVALMARGALLAWEVPQIVEFGAWFLAGPVLHDLVLAPVVGLLGLVLKGPVKTGAVVSGILVLIAVPLLWQPQVPVNPGLHDRNYWLGLAVSLGVVWSFVLASVVWRRRTPEPHGDG
ncbi:hypothetical protein [Kibdelosporangium phytohabitans]|uniref:Uncharacterized protein n=1 Tax=Kibdelosporangium phytohabitans TaxID=860235 RepID=A0A0N9HX19_9PSEU|nr:hypothetical protein [Kibdelosporangium phytohabitans]ALG06448.1 hypothetical protein AOZ06_05475 [Kibdelosporangium phytohabitans]MBE1467614.1 hypothetical protein [Kibdelosporangium phytohabitans]